MRVFPLPMFARYFVALVVLTILASALFGLIFGNYQEQVAADTVASTWARAIAATPPAAGAGRTTVQIDVELHRGEPPTAAYSIREDQRARALIAALASAGIAVSDVRLDDASDPPVTWLQIGDGKGLRWVGFDGGLQPARFRARTWTALGGLVLLMAAAAWWASRWVARPLRNLSRQVAAIGRGEVPSDPVRGPREIESLGTALVGMARQRAAFDEQRRVMLMGVSHDLRSPLTRMRVAADLLEHEPALRALLVRNVEHADAIIDSFLTYVRTDAEPVNERVDLAAVAAGAARLAELPTPPALAPHAWVRGNPTLLQRLVSNLLDNALKHGAPPIALAVRHDGDAVVLTVEDHGAGIADPQRMLRPFERGDASRSAGGSGLGLAIVARIVERHGGTLSIERATDGGARVVVRLPATA